MNFKTAEYVQHHVTCDPEVVPGAWCKEATASIRPRTGRTNAPYGSRGTVSPCVVHLADGITLRCFYTYVSSRVRCLDDPGCLDYANATASIMCVDSADGGETWKVERVVLTPQQVIAGNFRVVSPEVVGYPGPNCCHAAPVLGKAACLFLPEMM